MKNRYIKFKSLLDLLFAFLLLMALSPLLFVIYILVYLTLGKPVFFIQDRPGLNNKIFKLIKFRTMQNKFNKKNILLPDNKRLTRFGRFLRASSLDELPSLVNVLKGEMSFVGPRPLLVEYLKFYNEEQLKRHMVKPGITGLAQVNGRNTIDWNQKFKYDLLYIKKISFLMDINILLKTILKVFLFKSISYSEEIIMPKFKGNNKLKV
tara:strand:+ start:350 stop:973 length:624 start_codon:yes stop_codon:yes gene_type:complete